MIILCFFFFTSRRRHTRFSRDWSSDVCSSDLTGQQFQGDVADRVHLADAPPEHPVAREREVLDQVADFQDRLGGLGGRLLGVRCGGSHEPPSVPCSAWPATSSRWVRSSSAARLASDVSKTSAAATS